MVIPGGWHIRRDGKACVATGIERTASGNGKVRLGTQEVTGHSHAIGGSCDFVDTGTRQPQMLRATNRGRSEAKVTARSHLSSRSIKANGAHYTPAELATFLAEVTVCHAALEREDVSVLDPACGDGSLLEAISECVEPDLRRRMRLVGYETDAAAAENAVARLRNIGVAAVDIRVGDFLEMVETSRPTSGPSLFDQPSAEAEYFDIVISNPPYVRTQVLGAEKAQQLAARFGLTGRVDLYHAFMKAMSLVLRSGGVLGLLTSNRFMLIQSGASVRELLRTEFCVRDLYDLGDTKLFTAAVLPAIVVAQRRPAECTGPCSFARVYEIRNGHSSNSPTQMTASLLDALRKRHAGEITAAEGRFRVEQGELGENPDLSEPWSLTSKSIRNWLAVVKSHRMTSFGEIAKVRVGIKTTADPVFIRDDWDSLPEHLRPETELLRPLMTHHIAARWRAAPGNMKKVLYPHDEGPNGAKRAVNLASYPRAQAYLEQHRQRLEARRYVIDAGRQWYEIWVPQQPSDWGRPKVVYPDISEEPRFFLDRTGAIVNGDCYWITLREGVAEEYLLLLLAVANSTFITSYYDTVVHNKLYAGRRRFMTQYVRDFPLPSISCRHAKRILTVLSDMLDAEDVALLEDATTELDALVWASFGLKQKAIG